MQLQDLLYGVSELSRVGEQHPAVNAISIDSRKLNEKGCFIAISGTATDGHNYISQAIENGAVLILCEEVPVDIQESILYIQVKDSAAVAGIIAHNFYGQPSGKFTLLGVTGTNGKTTIATLLYDLFTSLGYTCGLIGTVQHVIAGEKIDSTHTTPDVIALNDLLSQMVNKKCEYVFMECSSHAIQQHRLAGLIFRGAIFSNITHDHLDYHGTFEEYIRVKKSWFDTLPVSAFAVSNADDRRGSVMLQNTKARKIYYSLKTLADVKGKILDNSLQGLHMMVNETEVYFRMIGEFNAYNLLAVYATAIALGEDDSEVLKNLSVLTGAEGRFDYMVSANKSIVGIVDYAHTPDALLNVLATIKKLKNGNEMIITVVGCGGNRDKAKRPLMGAVASEHSDRVIFTSDNPRNEEAAEIINQMQAGVKITAQKKITSIADRKEAIKTAVNFSDRNDIILVAGKGHEKYQEINGIKNPFDDKAVLKEMFELLEK